MPVGMKVQTRELCLVLFWIPLQGFGNSRQINQISHLLTEHGTLRDLKIRSGLRGIPKQIPYLQPIMEEEDFTDFIQTYIPNRKKGNYHRKHCTKLRRTIMLAGLI